MTAWSSRVSRQPWSRHVLWLWVAVALLPCFRASPGGIVRSVAVLLLIGAWLNRRRAIVALMYPFALIAPAAVYYQIVFRDVPGVGFWLVIQGSNAGEAFEYIRPFGTAIAAWVAGCSYAGYRLVRTCNGPVFATRRKRAVSVITAAAVLLAAFLGASRPDRPAVDVIAKVFERAYPVSLFTGYVEASREMRQLASDARTHEAVPTWVRSVQTTLAPRTVVLVIGESARRDRHQVYGYAAPTTPQAIGHGVLAFRDMVSLFPFTAQAVPVILAGYDMAAPNPAVRPGIVRLFRQAGFRTSWISSQAAMGKDEGLISVYAASADVQWFGRQLSRHGPIPYDEALLPMFRNVLEQTHSDQLIVLHLYGSHEDPGKRFPAGFRVVADDYDNSIAYSDMILGKIMDALANRPGQSMLMYVSDHGLKLGEYDGRTEHFDMKEAYEVPFYAWASASWIAAHGHAFATANGHLGAPLTTMNVRDSLMDMADLRYDGFDPGLSVFSDALRSTRRDVHTYTGTVDFDHARNDHDGHLVPAPPSSVQVP